MKSTAATIDASVKDPMKPEKEVICAMETFSTVYRAKIECYTQFKSRPHDFRIDCGTFDLAGHRWAISYYPATNIHTMSITEAALHIRLLTDTNTSLTLGGEISLIDPSGKPSKVGYISKEYNKRDDGHKMSIMEKQQLDSSEYVKDNCLTFECLVRATKWSPVEVVKETPQSTITTSNFWEDLSRHMEGGKGADVSLKICNDINKPI
ncbi:BTB/POZ and MATH domain-containing protein 3 [Carex littledalei]|uniref:BTB/POZ and MATH domain-containing protein 3 n=1 Tax=Carex littledalei TaxID=544730 RepID=A0A833VI76_9POAL|nr:BTB/POZ and MATH domain-containing protein 3 [Carex littledalei]